MDYTLPGAWDQDRRSFWTKRKRTATGLITVMSLLMGTAVAFKLFDQSIPNNVVRDASSFDFEVFKMDTAAGDTDFVNTADGGGTPVFEDGVETFPGTTREVEVRIDNTNVEPELDATMLLHIDQTKYIVTGCVTSAGAAVAVDENGLCEAGATTTTPTAISPTGTTANAYNRFLAFWSLTIQKEQVAGVQGGPEVNEDDHQGQNLIQPGGDPDESGNRQYAEACDAPLITLRSALASCHLGTVRAAGTVDALGEALDSRYYLFGLTEADDGDQSPYRGWALSFDLVFQAKVPADPEDGPVYQR